jgi:hypothetical protein
MRRMGTLRLLLCLLLVQIGITTANGQIMPHSPSTEKPIITFFIPQTNTSNQVVINFSITKPDSWFWEVPGGKGYFRNMGTIRSVMCTLDGSQVFYDDIPYGYAQGDIEGNKVKDFEVPMGSLATGQHIVTVTVIADTAYAVSASLPESYYNVSTNATYTFMVVFAESPSPSPSIPEFPAWGVPLLVVVAVAVAGLAHLFRRRKL